MLSERQKIIQAIAAANELLRRQAQQEYKKFVLYMKADYDMQWFHSYICERLQAFEQGQVKKLMILIPPQHGKTELATRLFPPFLLGKNPNRKIAITSYGDAIASGFNRDIQRYIDNEKYNAIFPDTVLPGSSLLETKSGTYSRTDHKFDIVGKRGTLKTVGRGGSLTSETVDIGIIDDLYKDRDEARSLTISENAWNWYIDVFRTRLHNDSQQLLMNTRWDELDLAGRLLVDEPNQWEVITFPALKTKDIRPYDPRQEGESLWEKKHSKEKILGQKNLSEVSFNSLYQQDPQPNHDVLIFPDWMEIPEWPSHLVEKVCWGLDFGKTSGINALVRCIETSTGYYFQECMYKRGFDEDEIIKVLQHYGYKSGEPVYCDYEPTKINALILKQIAAEPAIKGAGSVSFGINMLDGTKQGTKVYYTADSTNLKIEVKRYQYHVIGKIITNVPADAQADHLMDACRYASVAKYFTGQ